MLSADVVLHSALVALKPWYDQLRPRWLEFYSSHEMARLMPEVASPADLKTRIGLHRLHVHAGRSGDTAYVGLELGCTWDQEHGAGVLMVADNVVKVGGADISFAWLPPGAETG